MFDKDKSLLDEISRKMILSSIPQSRIIREVTGIVANAQVHFEEVFLEHDGCSLYCWFIPFPIFLTINCTRGLLSQSGRKTN
jgi:hypothetical protein